MADWVCADCGHEQETWDNCAKCQSIRVVLISVVEEVFGPDWKKTFE